MRAAGGPRLVVVASVGLLVAAALLWGASIAVWYRVGLPDRPSVELTGGQVSPVLTAVALLALAGVAAAVATGGAVRRTLGGLLAAAAVAVGVVPVRVLLAPTAEAGAALADATGGAPVDPLRQQVDLTAAPLLAVAGAVALFAVGVFVLIREPHLAHLGARYAGRGHRPVEADPDRVAWQELDAGRDPTADALGKPGDDPGGGSSGRLV